MDLLGTGPAGQQQQPHQPSPSSSASGAAQIGAQMNCGGIVGGGERPAYDAMSRPSLISSLWSIQVQNEGSASDYPMAGCGSQQSLPEMLNQAMAGGGGSGYCCNGFGGGGGSPSSAAMASSTGGAAGVGHFHHQHNPIVDQVDLAGATGPMPMDHQSAAMASFGGAAANQMPGTSSSSLRPVKSLSDLHTLTAAQIAQTAAVMPYPNLHAQCAAPNPGPAVDQSYLGFRRQTETGTYYTMLSRQQRDSQICEWLQKLNVSGGMAENSGSESPSQEFYQQQQQRPPPPFHRADTTEQ